MKNLYLVYCDYGKMLVAADDEEKAEDIAYTGLDFGNCINKVEFIAVVGGEYGIGKILKYFE
jgi:hypothetical protein